MNNLAKNWSFKNTLGLLLVPVLVFFLLWGYLYVVDMEPMGGLAFSILFFLGLPVYYILLTIFFIAISFFVNKNDRLDPHVASAFKKIWVSIAISAILAALGAYYVTVSLGIS